MLLLLKILIQGCTIIVLIWAKQSAFFDGFSGRAREDGRPVIHLDHGLYKIMHASADILLVRVRALERNVFC